MAINQCCYLTFLVIVSLNSVGAGNDVIVSDFQINDGDENISNHEPGNSEPFIATSEWQVIKNGQAIPAGLHVRMNFQTGVKEAKLMESSKEQFHDDGGPKIITSPEINELHEPDGKLYFTKSQLKEALKDFRDKIGTKEVIDDITWSADAKEALESFRETKPVKRKFRTMNEIKDELENKMGWKLKSDIEAMKELIEFLADGSHSVEQKEAALDGLEDYVHEIDNARDLERIGGLVYIVNLLNDTNEKLQVKAANVLGAAAQNNHAAQDAIFQHGGLPFLIQMLHSNKLPFTKKKGLFALSALVRGNLKAQKELFKFNGISKILKIIKDPESGPAKIKGVTLLYDLVVEEQERLNKLPEDDLNLSLSESPLLNEYVKLGWCATLLQLLHTDDWETKEKTIQALEISVVACKEFYSSPDAKRTLKEVADNLNKSIIDEDDDDFKSYLNGLLTQFNKNILSKLS